MTTNGTIGSHWDWFWNEDIWLPKGSKWTDLQNPSPNGLTFPEFKDLFYYGLPGGILLLCIRFVFERTISIPFGKWLGLLERKNVSFSANPILEKVFKTNKSKKGVFSGKELEDLAKETGLEIRQVQRWLRKRAILQKPTNLKKFSESAWRSVMYLTTTSVGIYTLWDKEWVWDFSICFQDYPLQNLGSDIWFHYMLSVGLYSSLMISQFVDRARKDFWEMFIHHVITLLLLALSWSANFVRVGSSVLILHDLADVVLEVGKMGNYAGKLNISNTCFGIFTVIWFITRLYILPVHILRSVNVDAPQMMPISPVFQLMNVMLTLLFGIQLFWTWYIVKMIIRALSKGGTVEKDARSSSEGNISDSDRSSRTNQADKKNS